MVRLSSLLREGLHTCINHRSCITKLCGTLKIPHTDGKEQGTEFLVLWSGLIEGHKFISLCLSHECINCSSDQCPQFWICLLNWEKKLEERIENSACCWALSESLRSNFCWTGCGRHQTNIARTSEIWDCTWRCWTWRQVKEARHHSTCSEPDALHCIKYY